MADLNICPAAKSICIVRGDSTPMTFQMQDENSVDIDITGRSYLMSVNTEENPVAPTTNTFQLTGALGAGPPTALVTFTPTVVNTDITPGEYYYDIQETNGAALRTVVKGVFEVQQDITK